ncbi:MAG: DUF962 domain-containing protein [Deltaproteobacteria bacterium]|nr:MAG: DUF962 domain-containing protein [Deltaproteobacteria bacterium]
MSRIESFQAFWPYYISEHRDATSRRLHFLGTSGFFASCAVSTALNPVGFPLAMAGMLAIGTDAVKRVEKNKRSLPHVLGMIALPTLASPVVFPAGVVFAYGCAWAGHFRFEGNRPATFDYPVWSLASDMRMWSHMVRGKLWSGDAVEELGLEAPAAAAAK